MGAGNAPEMLFGVEIHILEVVTDGDQREIFRWSFFRIQNVDLIDGRWTTQLDERTGLVVYT